MFRLYNNDCANMQLENIKLIYLDPPFGSKREDKFYGATENFEEYLDYMRVRLEKLKTFMHPDGANIIVHIDQKASHYIKVMMDGVFGRENFLNHIVWCYTGPSVVKAYLPRKHDDLLWYGVGDYTFNQETISYQAKLKVGGNTSWNPDKKGTEEEYLAKGKKLEDWWVDIPSLCRNEKEKRETKYPTQKPLKLMSRIIKMFSNEGDTVYDPFMGSGSFLHAAIELNRQALGSDISDKAITLATERLSKIAK